MGLFLRPRPGPRPPSALVVHKSQGDCLSSTTILRLLFILVSRRKWGECGGSGVSVRYEPGVGGMLHPVHMCPVQGDGSVFAERRSQPLPACLRVACQSSATGQGKH